MDDLLKKLKDCSRQLELEDSIPYWEGQLPELKARVRELKANRDNKELQIQRLENPGLLRRFFGGGAAKQEQLKQQLNQSNAAWTAAKWDLQEQQRKLEAGKKEYEALVGSREAYAAARQTAVLNPAQESRLMMEELSAFAPLALSLAERTLLPLQNAQLLGTETGEMRTNLLSDAVESAVQLRQILEVLPEGCADIGGFLENPNGFLYATAAAYGQQNRLNLAVAQILRVVNQLRAILGE